MDRNIMNDPSAPPLQGLTVAVPPLPGDYSQHLARERVHMVTQYILMSENNNGGDSIPPPKADLSAPPPYDLVAGTKLPSYEDVQREKQMAGETTNNLSTPQPPPPPLAAFLALEAVEGQTDFDADNGLLGTDFMFFTAFFIAFLFNWIGFLLLMCFCHTIASRYGALSGFGLSLAKWTLIVKHSTELASRDNSWLCWLIMAFGMLICIRAIIQYLNIKRGWRLLSGTAQERLLFFH